MNGDGEAGVAAGGAGTSRTAVPRNRFPSATAAVMAAGVLGLMACTGPAAPVGSVPGSTVTASPTLSATPVPVPTRPSEKATPDSAIAFVQYFVALYNYGYKTLDTRPLNSIALSNCEYCQSVAKDIKRLATENDRISAYTVELRGAASPPGKIARGTTVIAVINQRPGIVMQPDGTRRKLSGVKNLRAKFGLDWSNSRWKIRGVDIDSGSGTPWLN